MAKVLESNVRHRRRFLGAASALFLSVVGCLTPPGDRAPVALASAVPEPPPREPVTGAKPIAVPGLPGAIAWTASNPLIVPKSDAKHDLLAVKDPSVVRFNERWHVYATSVGRGGTYGMVYTSFADWKDAPSAPLYYMDRTPGFDTYVAAPQLFYVTPQKRWYLVFQSGPPMFATADDPGDPTKWTTPAPFFSHTPAAVEKNGGWLDFWVICDAQSCYLFF